MTSHLTMTTACFYILTNSVITSKHKHRIALFGLNNLEASWNRKSSRKRDQQSRSPVISFQSILLCSLIKGGILDEVRYR